jgi:hypothetical protein
MYLSYGSVSLKNWTFIYVGRGQAYQIDLTCGPAGSGTEGSIYRTLQLYNDQHNAQVFNLFIYLLLPYMFQAFF